MLKSPSQVEDCRFVDRNDGHASIKGVRKLMLFDLSVGGHHPGYILHLIKHWCEQEAQGCLDIVVLPEFVQQHGDVVDAALSYGQKNVNFVTITIDEKVALGSRQSSISRALRAFREWDLLCKYAAGLKATHCLLMYFDTSQLPMFLGRRPPCPFSGIYFRPTFHYGSFAHYLPSWKDRMQHWREKFDLSQVLRNPQLQTLFCLDPFVVKQFEQFSSKVKAVYLPDPVQIYSNSVQPKKLKESLGIHSDRQVFLLFGALDGRKGIHQLLEAIFLLPSTLCQKICLLLVGPISSGEKALVQERISQIRQSLPVQIVTHDKFVAEQEIQPYFQIADVVLAPYQRHIGMSAILVRAAAAQKPVLCSDYGLMGEITHRHHLGLTVDSTNKHEIAQGLTKFLLASPTELSDRSKMQSFAEQNSAQEFANVIFQHV